MKQRIFATALALVMLFTTVGAMPVSAAGNDPVVLTTEATGGSFTDNTADADTAYEYTITGSDGSVETIVVPAAETGDTETGNSITGPHAGVAGVYYQLVTDLSNGIPEGTYLLVDNNVAVANTNKVSEKDGWIDQYALSPQMVTIENNRIIGENTALEWKISGSNGTYRLQGSDGNYLNLNGESILSDGVTDVTVAFNGNEVMFKGIDSIWGDELCLYYDIYEASVYAQYNDDWIQPTYYSLYKKMEVAGGDYYYTVDTTGLNALIAECASLNSRNYTAGSWAVFQNALNAAKALQNPTERYETAEAAQPKLNEVNAAQAALVAARASLEELEVLYPTISWTRTQDNDNQTGYLNSYSNSDGPITSGGVEYKQYTALNWNWSALEKLIDDQETKQTNVWNYTENPNISAASINTGGGNWKSARVHKISGTFEWPAGYDLNNTTITLQSANDEYYAPIYEYIADNGLSDQFPNGKVFPVNDDVYVVMWVEDGSSNAKPTVDNINDYLLFWTGTSGKGIWSQRRVAQDPSDWDRTTPATFLSASKQGVRAFHNSWPNAVGVSANLSNYDVAGMDPNVLNYLKQSDGWYTMTDTTAINSIMRNNYPDGIAAGAKVHLDLYVFNNDGTGGIDELEISLAKQAQTETSVVVNYYYGSVTTPADVNAFLGTTTLTNIPFGTEITLRNGTNAAQLNHMKAVAITKAGGLVTDGVQQGTIPYVVQRGIDNVINVLYLPDGVENVTYTFDFGMTNVYGNVLEDNEWKSVKSVDVVDNGFDVNFDMTNNEIRFTPKAATTDRAMVTLKLHLNDNTIVNKVVYFVAASNVLYEENFLTTTGDSGWTQNGSAAKVTITDNMSTVYGYTDSYKNSTSKNGAYEATVSPASQFTGDLNFRFSGTGFDLLSTCGPNTGTLMVRVNDGSGNYVKAYIVDTAFNDETYGTINQVPLIHEQNLANGTYELVIRGAYINYSAAASTASTFGMRGGSSNAISDLYDLMYSMGLTDDQIDEVEFISVDTNSASTYALNRVAEVETAAAPTEMNLNVDGVRVYLPTNNSDYSNEERGVTYYNVLDAVNGNNITAYIEAGSGTYAVTDYELAGGPQNEIYLKNNQAVAFKVSGKNPVQVSLRNVNGVTNAAVMGTNTTITHSTEMYYEVTPQNGIVTVQNTGNGLLAICNLKFPATASVDYLVEEDYPVVFAMLRSLAAPEAPEVSEPTCGGTACEYKYVEAKKATCTEGGSTEYWYCEKHDNYYVMGINGLTSANATDVLTNPDENGHYEGCPHKKPEVSEPVCGGTACEYKHVESKEATCTEGGNAEYWYCEKHDNYYVMGENGLTAANATDVLTNPDEDSHYKGCPHEAEKVFVPNKLNTKISSVRLFTTKVVTLTVTTSTDVKYITVNGKKVYSSLLANLLSFNRSRTFILTDIMSYKDVASYEIIAYSADGTASEAKIVSR